MFSDLNVFKTAMAMASHASRRQAVTAQNLANSDTPGFRAKELVSFKDSYQPKVVSGMHATRSGHIGAQTGASRWETVESDTPTDPNGNSVSVELEMVNAVNIRSQHNRALAVYRSSMTMLRTSLGKF